MIKKNLSVFMLIARSSIYKFLGLLFLMVCGEVAAFYLFLRRDMDYAAQLGTSVSGIDFVFEYSRILWIFAAAYILTAVLLSFTGCHFSSHQGYTLRRLSVSEKSVFIWQSLYNAICFFILWAIQVFAAFALCYLYIHLLDDPEQSAQTVFLIFYRNKFLHCLLPLREASMLVRNIFFVAALGVGTAWFPYVQRRGRVAYSSIQIIIVAAVFFYRDIGSFSADLAVCLLMITYVANIIWRLIDEEKL